MDADALARVAQLLAERNRVDAELATITGRPMAAGHLGEWIASQVFDIQLSDSAVTKALDGHFVSGPLAGSSVNIKWYGKREGLLDMVDDPSVEYYLAMTGPRASATTSRGTRRPLVIDAVYLFHAAKLLEELRPRGVKIGVATSVRAVMWDAAEMYPQARSTELVLSAAQRDALARFSPRSIGSGGTAARPTL